MDIEITTDPPFSFKYRTVYEKGKPVHEKYDPFSIKHPAMDLRKRAKIFAPFDALKGFNEAISSKNMESAARKEYEDDNHILCDYTVFMEDYP